ncbi:zinc finger (MYND type) family protein / programmed cell death 2 C-terminal domain-containing protein [Tasmannia lanceolata]|uniref:zinc finger (MYND type) family protein / programmed cell death 2 C-terminal domain-containing protein n=1 Tax=Tasmannia lanceolata TaxID=3420 RepID=UPI00406286B8
MEIEDKGNNLQHFRSLKISSLDEEVEEEQLEDDEEEEEEEDEEEVLVALGFVEKPKNPCFLQRQFFPSKAGGVPAWLDPVDLPSEKCRICDICREPLQFLLQVYAPISEKESTFHRTLFLFMCTSMACLLQDQHEQWKRRPEKPSRSVKVFRSQLPRSNPFYSSEPPSHVETHKPSGAGATLCSWCGTWKGEKVCGSCRRAHYCSEKHQVMHWRSGHKIDCQRISLSSQPSECSQNNSRKTLSEVDKVSSNTLWPEYEIISEDECAFNEEVSEVTGSANSLVSKDQMDESLNSLLDKFEGDDDKRSWASFQERIVRAPEQVLRYCRDEKAKPLWPMSSGRPSKEDVPKCNYCDGPLCFEFQVLPQLLYYFGVRNDADSLDWSTVAIYTCAASCEASVSYKEEFAWVQLSSSSAI